MLELSSFFKSSFNSFGNFTCLEALYADADPFGSAIYDSADDLQVWKESTPVDTGYLLADAAFFLGKAPAGDRSAGYWLFTAYFAYFRHFVCSVLDDDNNTGKR